MHKKQHLFAALVAFALVNTGLCFAQEESSETASYESTEETPAGEATSEEAPVQAPQPIYYIVPAQTQAPQNVPAPAEKSHYTNISETTASQPLPVATSSVRESRVSLFFEADLSYYLTSQSYEEESEYDLSTSRDDVYAYQYYDGQGFAVGLSLGAVIKDFIGLRGFINIGMQSGESSYESKDVRCDSCSNISTDWTDYRFGAVATLFPFNSTRNALYNSYLDITLGAAIHERDDDVAEYYDREVTATGYLKFEIGKLFPISKSWNIGFGVAYSLDYSFTYSVSSTEEIDYGDFGHSLWVGARFAFKRNKD